MQSRIYQGGSMYQDINGNQFESYAQACNYYGGENDDVLQGEADALAEEYESTQTKYGVIPANFFFAP
jgi:hypothetical protein